MERQISLHYLSISFAFLQRCSMDVQRRIKTPPRCSKMLYFDGLTRLLDLCQRADPVIILCKSVVMSCNVRLCSRGHSKRGSAGPLLVVSIGEVLRMGRKRNLPFLSVVFFVSFSWTSKRKRSHLAMKNDTFESAQRAKNRCPIGYLLRLSVKYP